MRTIAVFVELDEVLNWVIESIINDFPCFLDYSDDDCLTITARQEYMASIEHRLAPFV